MNIDDIVNQVESILRLRAAVRSSRENIARETTALSTNVENLTQLEHDLAVMVGGDVAKNYAKSAWHEATLTLDRGWEQAAAERDKPNEREKFDRRIKKGDVVWMVRRKALGTVTRVDRYGAHTVEADGKTYQYTARNLRMPLPHDVGDWREKNDES